MTRTTLVNRLLAALLALALLLGGLLAAAEIVLAQLNRPHWLVPREQWSGWLRDQTWDTLIPRLILAGLVVLGLILLALALRRGKPRTLPVATRSEGVTVSLSRRGVEHTLAAAARRTDGVRGASASAGRRSVKVKAETAMRSPGTLQQDAASAVTQRLQDLGLADTLRARVKLKTKGAR